MPLFLVVSEKHSASLEEHIKKTFPEDHYVMGRNHWLIATDKTTSAVAKVLEIHGGGVSGDMNTVVFKISGRSGWHYSNLWEWIELKLREGNG